jgi:hypothetical protein
MGFDRDVVSVAGTRSGRSKFVDRPRVRRAALRLIHIDDRETDLVVRGFSPCSTEVRRLLELHGRSFAAGFNGAIASPSIDELSDRLAAVSEAERGFAFEGAGMGLALLDLLVPRSSRLGEFLRTNGARSHVYLVHVGAGWALARLRRRPWRRLELDPLLRWLAIDGFGFHGAFFAPGHVVRRRGRPGHLAGYQRRVFDQGVGRGLWFVETASPERVAASIGGFEPRRRADLWSGAALAAAYAGGVDARGYARLLELGGEHAPHLRQGVAFAAAARTRAGNVVLSTETACSIVCGVDAERACAITDRALVGVAADGSGEAYEAWRTRIRAEFGGA